MTKNALTRNSIILGLLIILSLIFSCIFKIQKESLEANCSFPEISNNNEQNNPLLLQDSLIMNTDSVKTIVYFGYNENKNSLYGWDDIIEVYQIKNNDTILNNSFHFFRQTDEGIPYLYEQSEIPNEKIYPPSFIICTAISMKGNFSENFFIYDTTSNKYLYEKRVNYMYNMYDPMGFPRDTIGLKTIFEIKNKYLIDSIEMNKLFDDEKKIYNGIVLKNSEWITR